MQPINTRLTDREKDMMDILWAAEEALTARALFNEFTGRGFELPYTRINTLLRNLIKKGLVQQSGLANTRVKYISALTREEYIAAVAKEIGASDAKLIETFSLGFVKHIDDEKVLDEIFERIKKEARRGKG